MVDKEDVESGPEKDNADVMSLDKALSDAMGSGDTDEATDKAAEAPEQPEAEETEGEGEDDTSDDREAGEEAGEAETGEEGEGDQDDLSAPDHWPAERREAFAKLPKDARELVLAQSRDLERGFTRKSQELSEDARLAAAIRKEFEPLRDKLNLSGVDEAAAIRQLLAAQQYLERDPAGGLKYLADQYGVDLGSLSRGSNAQQQQGRRDGEKPKYVDPEIAALEQKISGFEQHLNQQQQAQLQARQAEVQRQIAEFRDAKDDAGNPAHPHFEAVQNEMARLVQAGVASDLKDAYDKAVWANPDIRKQQIEAERKAVAEAEERKRKEAVEKAKKAGRRVKGDNRPGTEPAEARDLDSILSAAIEKNSG